MGKRARDDTLLATLVRMALPQLQDAERESPRTGPGDKPKIPDWLIGALIMIAVLVKKKSKSAQYRYLQEHRKEIAEWLGNKSFPSRSTYFRRYRRAHRIYRTAIRLQGELAIAERVTDLNTSPWTRASSRGEVRLGTSGIAKPERSLWESTRIRPGATPSTMAGFKGTATRSWSVARPIRSSSRCWPLAIRPAPASR